MKKTIAAVLVSLAGAASAATIVDVDVSGRQKYTVEIHVSNQMFTRCLAKNLDISGLFSVGQAGAIKVDGAPGAIRA